MKITDELVDRVSNLAKLEFKGKARTKIKEDLYNILQLCEKLNRVDTGGVEPLIYLNDEDPLREDKPGKEVSREEALKNAPSKDSDYFKVPRVIER